MKLLSNILENAQGIEFRVRTWTDTLWSQMPHVEAKAGTELIKGDVWDDFEWILFACYMGSILYITSNLNDYTYLLNEMGTFFSNFLLFSFYKENVWTCEWNVFLLV